MSPENQWLRLVHTTANIMLLSLNVYVSSVPLGGAGMLRFPSSLHPHSLSIAVHYHQRIFH